MAKKGKKKEERVLLSIPKDAWETLEETLEMDSISSAFDEDLREEISKALGKVKDASAIAKALEEFVNDVDATGGVAEDRKGFMVPVADPEWVDLGETYMKACGALNRKPKTK